MPQVAQERQFSTDKREKLADKGKALPDGSFPIENRQDLLNAIKLVGKAKDPARAKAHIIKRARALGLTSSLPDDWQTSAPESVSERIIEVTSTAAEAVFTNSEDGTRPRAEIVIIRPGQNKSGGSKAKYYTAESIAEAVGNGFWAGAPMFVDHGPDEKMPKKRSARDLVSAISSKPGEVWLGQEGEARGMVDFFNPEWATFAERAQEHIGISNNADIAGRRYRDMNTREMNVQVDHFTNRHSVDWVAFPAAGGGVAQFMTATESEDDMGVDWDALTPEMLAEHRPDLLTQLRATESDDGGGDDDGDGKDDGEETPPAGLTAAQVRKMIDEGVAAGVKTAQEALVEEGRKAADVRAKVGDQLASSGLPAKIRSRIAADFDGQTEYVEATVQEAIDEAKDELKELGVNIGPKPTEFGNGGGTTDEKKIVDLSQEAIDGAPALSYLLGAVVKRSNTKQNGTVGAGKGN